MSYDRNNEDWEQRAASDARADLSVRPVSTAETEPERPRCDCGNPNASWWTTYNGRREYCCTPCLVNRMQEPAVNPHKPALLEWLEAAARVPDPPDVTLPDRPLSNADADRLNRGIADACAVPQPSDLTGAGQIIAGLEAELRRVTAENNRLTEAVRNFGAAVARRAAEEEDLIERCTAELRAENRVLKEAVKGSKPE